MSLRGKVLVGIGVVILLGALVFQALRADRGDTVEVRAEEVGLKDLVARVTATGHIEPKRSVEIQSDISGRIVRLPVAEGQDVQRGDLLLEIDPTQYRAAVRQAEARLSETRSRAAQARADYLQAQRDWKRLETLKERTPDLVTDQEAEQTRTQAEVRKAQWEAAQHSVQQAEAALEEARDRLEKTVIRAPMSGRITRLNVEEGETAIVGTMNNPGSHLLTIADLSVMEAVVEVDETDVTRVEAGDSVTVEIDAYPDRSFAGRVTTIGNSSMRPRNTAAASGQDEAVDFEVRVLLSDPPTGIRSDLSCTAEIVTAKREDVPAIPIIALTLQDTSSLPADWRGEAPDRPVLDDGAVEGVFLVRGDRARFRPVRVGIAGDSYFEVLAGLAAGDTVVSGSFQAIRELEDGTGLELTRVEVPERGGGSDGGATSGGTEVPPSGAPPADPAGPEEGGGAAGGGAPPGAPPGRAEDAARGDGGETPRRGGAQGDRGGATRTGERGGGRDGDGSGAPGAAGGGADSSALRPEGGVEPDVPRAFYAVVTSSRDSAAVARLLDRLEDAGHAGHVRPFRDDRGRRWWRGLVGPFETRVRAEARAQRLGHEEDVDAWVTDLPRRDGDTSSAGA